MSGGSVPDPYAGTRILAAALNVEDPADLLALHPPDSVPGVLAPLLAHAVLTTDELDQQLVRVASSAAQDLLRMAEGRVPHITGRNGLLNATGAQIDVLAARRGQEIDHLERLMTAYSKSLAASPDGHRAEQRTSERTAHRPTAPTRVSLAQVKAMEVIAQGGVRLCDSGLAAGPFVSAPRGAHTSRPTVDALIARKLVTRDTSTSLFVGQSLSLTAQGEAFLADVHARTSPRAEAARSRTTAADTGSSPSVQHALPPAPNTAPDPRRTR